MTNNTEPQTRKERRRITEAENYAFALAFVVESVIDENVEDLTDITMMDIESLNEFAETYGTTRETILKAVADIRNVVSFLSAE